MSKKDVPAIVSAMGVLMSLLDGIVKAVKAAGGKMEDLYQLATPAGESVLAEIGQLIAKAGKSSILLISRTHSFDPANFIAANWAFWRGPKDGNGLEGEEERDKASTTIMEVDFSKAEFLTCLKDGEPSITGEEKLARLKKIGRTLYGATVFMGLWQDYQSCQNKAESVLERLYQQRGITYIDFFGDILRSPNGRRSVLYLYRGGVGQWDWGCDWLGSGWSGRVLSAVSRQVS